MTVTFGIENAQRPDPYLDWEFRTRPDLPGSGFSRGKTTPKDPWCSLYIRVKPVNGTDQFANLRRLANAVAAGRLEDDVSPSGATIRMADDERQHLLDLINTPGKLQPGDDVLWQFFVYRRESLIYSEEGDYAPTDLYEVILAGPPIPGLSFDNEPKVDSGIRPSKIDKLPDIDRRGVAIGIVDDGIAFAHERFRNESGETRVMAIWLQDVERAEMSTDARGRPDPGIAFGVRLDRDEINRLLAKHAAGTDADIYRDEDVGVTDFGRNTYNPLALRATHGTHVLDVAAGYDPSIPGETSSDKLRPILAVQLPSIATLDTSGVTMGSYVLQAVRQIMLWAERLGENVPLIINFSYGLSAGPKDGTHPLELALNQLIEHRNTRASTCLVLPAGNSFRARTTARMDLKTGQAESLDWIVLPDDPTPNYLEIWLDREIGTDDKASPIEVILTPPGGLPADTARPDHGKLSTIKLDGHAVAATYYSVSDPQRIGGAERKRGRIFIAINHTVSNDGRVDCAPAGRWQLTLVNRSERAVAAHLYIQRDSTPFGYRRPGRQSFFDHAAAHGRDERTGDYDRLEREKDCPITQEETLSALATLPLDEDAKGPPGFNTRICVVGSAEASERFVPATYTSSGPTAKRRGPNCSAVTEEGRAHWGLMAAGTFSGSLVKMSGTSVAAPQVVRYIGNAFVGNRKGLPPVDENEVVPSRAPPGVADQDTFATPVAGAKHRLGSLVIQRRLSRRLLRRRYSTLDSDDEITL